jgi:hypothetical protein
MRLSATVCIAVVGAVAALVLCPLSVLANPIPIEMVIDFDPPGYVHSVYPVPYTTINAFVVGDFSATTSGINSVAFRLALTPVSLLGLSFQSSGPIIQITGDWETGIVVYSTDCLDDFPVALGYLSIFYLGGEGYVSIEPHLDVGSEYTACDNPGVPLEFCLVQDGGVGTNAPDPRFICQTPVENVTWSAIKTLYR